jgi:hypothetical protein
MITLSIPQSGENVCSLIAADQIKNREKQRRKSNVHCVFAPCGDNQGTYRGENKILVQNDQQEFGSFPEQLGIIHKQRIFGFDPCNVI